MGVVFMVGENKMKKGNYLYLGIVTIYLVFAVSQFFKPELLPFPLYYNASWIAFELTLLEVAKTSAKIVKERNDKMLIYMRKEIDLCSREANHYKRFSSLSKECETLEKQKGEMEKQLEVINNDRKVIIIEKCVNIMTILQMIFCSVQFAFIFISEVPDTLQTNKIVNVLSLASFALMVLTIFISRLDEDDSREADFKVAMCSRIREDKLEIMDKISNGFFEKDVKDE